MENSNIKKTKMILHKLMEVKDEKDPEWRQKTKLNLERAAFHSKQETKQFKDLISLHKSLFPQI